MRLDTPVAGDGLNALHQYAVTEDLNDLEEAASSLALTVDLPLPARLRGWVEIYLRRQARDVDPVDELDTAIGVTQIVHERLRDRRWLWGSAWLALVEPGQFELTILSFCEAGASKAQVEAIRRAVASEGRRIRRHLPVAPVHEARSEVAGRSTAEDALRYVATWIRARKADFYDHDVDGPSIRRDFVGRADRGSTWVGIDYPALVAVLDRAGFDATSTIASWNERGWCARDAGGRPYHQARVGARRPRLVALRRWALEAFDNRDAILPSTSA